MNNKIKLSEKQKMYIEDLAPIGTAPGLIRAIQDGKTIIVAANGSGTQERLLLKYLKEIDCNVIDASKMHIASFPTARQGRGGER